nr:GIY-YIG nuclease family protein [Aeromicrobium sp. CFBP 8757]
MSSLSGRLVVEWSKDTINWAKSGTAAARFPIVEIADPARVPFPGYDFVRVSHDQLQDVISDPRYESWRTALGSVQGIYVITDTDSGKLYVGKADGAERIFGRWSQYAKDGHGGNKGLLELVGLDPDHAKHYAFSILRVFGPTVPTPEVDAAEEHYKNALQTKKPFGLNHN